MIMEWKRGAGMYIEYMQMRQGKQVEHATHRCLVRLSFPFCFFWDGPFWGRRAAFSQAARPPRRLHPSLSAPPLTHNTKSHTSLHACDHTDQPTYYPVPTPPPLNTPAPRHSPPPAAAGPRWWWRRPARSRPGGRRAESPWARAPRPCPQGSAGPGAGSG